MVGISMGRCNLEGLSTPPVMTTTQTYAELPPPHSQPPLNQPWSSDSGMSHRGPQMRPVFQILVCHLATASSELVTSAADLREKIIAAGPDSTSNFELTAGDVVRPPSIVQCQHLAKGSTRQAHAHFQRWSGRLLTPSACCAVIRRPDDANQRPNRDDQRADHF